MCELEFLTVREFAKKLKMSDSQVREWLNTGRIKGIRVTEDKKHSPWRIPLTELRRVHAQAYDEEYR